MFGATGRAALILSAVFFLSVGDPSQAAPAAPAGARSDSADKSAETVKYTKHRRHYAHHRSSRTAQKSDDKAGRKDATDSSAQPSSAMPPTVANANAQFAAADTPTAATATAMTARANDNVQAAADNTAPAAQGGDSQVTASDQLNDVDRALQQEAPPAQRTVLAAADAQPRPAPVMAASGSESSTWDQTSLIGKIFIGFGALLTLASAARMFMA